MYKTRDLEGLLSQFIDDEPNVPFSVPRGAARMVCEDCGECLVEMVNERAQHE